MVRLCEIKEQDEGHELKGPLTRSRSKRLEEKHMRKIKTLGEHGVYGLELKLLNVSHLII